MERGVIIESMGKNMKANGKIIEWMEKESYLLRMEKSIQASLSAIKRKELEFMNGVMGGSMPGSGKKASRMELEEGKRVRWVEMEEADGR